MTKKKFTIVGMHCVSCAMGIDGDLEDTEGIKTSCTNYAKAQTEVEFDPEKVSEEQLVSIITKAGYKAEPM